MSSSNYACLLKKVLLPKRTYQCLQNLTSVSNPRYKVVLGNENLRCKLYSNNRQWTFCRFPVADFLEMEKWVVPIFENIVKLRC